MFVIIQYVCYNSVWHSLLVCHETIRHFQTWPGFKLRAVHKSRHAILTNFVPPMSRFVANLGPPNSTSHFGTKSPNDCPASVCISEFCMDASIKLQLYHIVL